MSIELENIPQGLIETVESALNEDYYNVDRNGKPWPKNWRAGFKGRLSMEKKREAAVNAIMATPKLLGIPVGKSMSKGEATRKLNSMLIELKSGKHGYAFSTLERLKILPIILSEPTR